MTTADIRDMLRRACETAGSNKAWAGKHGVSEAYVSDVLNGHRSPGPAICTALGIEQVYRKVKHAR